MSPTLPQITDTLDALSERNKILLLDYLADRWSIEIDTQRAALEYAHNLPCFEGTNGDAADRYADDLIPQGLCGALILKAHREKRDADLAFALGGFRTQTHVRAA